MRTDHVASHTVERHIKPCSKEAPMRVFFSPVQAKHWPKHFGGMGEYAGDSLVSD